MSTPFSSETPNCPSSGCQEINTYRFSTSVRPDNSFVVPNCGGTSTFTASDIDMLQIGSYLWSKEYGYLEVISFNPLSHQITVLNHCNEGNIAVGSQVSACSDFDVIDPPFIANNPQNGGICVAVDFTAPAIGDCILITLTDTTGIITGDSIQIGTGTYVVGVIVGSTVLSICNDGDGLIAGTPVIAKNGAGEYQYCISILGNCCTTIQNRFGGTLDPCSSIADLIVVQSSASGAASGTLNNIGNSVETAEAGFNYTNTSPCRTLKAKINVYAIGVVTMVPPLFFAPGFGFNIEIFEKVDAGAYVSVASLLKAKLIDSSTPGTPIDGFQIVFNKTLVLAPGAAQVLRYKGRITRVASSGVPGNASVASFLTKATTLAVAV